MNCRSLAFTVAAFSSLHVASADAQSIYVAPGGVYVGAGPVYVIPATNGAAPCVAPTNGYQCGPPVVIAPPPAVVAPTAATAAPALNRCRLSCSARVTGSPSRASIKREMGKGSAVDGALRATRGKPPRTKPAAAALDNISVWRRESDVLVDMRPPSQK